MIHSLFLTSNLLISVLMLVTALFVFTFIIFPYLKISSYKRKDIATYFFPIIGYMHYIRKAIQEKDDGMAYAKGGHKNTKNAKVLVSNLSNSVLFVLRDPQYVKWFLQNQNLYRKGRLFSVFKLLIGDGLVAAEGEAWKRHRKIISNSFHFEFLKSNMNIIQGTTREFLDKITSADYSEFPAISKIQEITGEIVGRIFFGERLNNYTFEGKPLTLALADIGSELAMSARTALPLLIGAKALKIPFIPRYKRIMRRIRDFRQICFDIIQDRKANPMQGKDLLGSLLDTQKLDDPELRFSDDKIVDDFITFFVAGMDTTGHLVGMTLYSLTQYPEYLTKLKEERDSTYNQEQQITIDTLHKMDTLHSLLKETLRFYTPVPSIGGRVALADHMLVDLNIKKGDLVFLELLAAPFDNKYIENPHKFDPSRWTDPYVKIDPFTFVPFSAGPRNCIGQHLALIEAKVIVSEFLERFEFKMKDAYELKMILRLLYEPEQDVLLNLSPKNK